MAAVNGIVMEGEEPIEGFENQRMTNLRRETKASSAG